MISRSMYVMRATVQSFRRDIGIHSDLHMPSQGFLKAFCKRSIISQNSDLKAPTPSLLEE
jgi:hypothetical protein